MKESDSLVGCLRPSVFGVGLAGLLVFAAAVRLAVLASPLGELDGDEAVVGLMARHIAYLGDRPVFYYNQQYLGSIEAFTAAPLFLLFGGSSTFLLKLVPTAYSLGFVALSAFVARRLFGVGPALATAAYAALGPAMLTVWSTKARGGYAELLFFGAALLLATLWLGDRRRGWWGAFLWGLLAGLSFWNHLLGIVYLIPCGVYLLARRRKEWAAIELPAAVVGAIVGALPMIVYNVTTGFPTVVALMKPADLPLDPIAQFLRFFRVGIPVLLGLGQPTTSAQMFDLDWLNRPAGNLAVVAVALALVGAATITHLPALRRLFSRACEDRAKSGPALLILLAASVPPVVAFTRFGFFVSEPRYALPMYSAVPLVLAALWRLPKPAIWGGLAALLTLNVYSLVSTDVRMWRPEEAVDSTATTRAALVQHLVAQDRHQMYTDYWIAYPVMFETRETVLGYVISGGFNRYFPHADNVQRTPNPAWIFVPGSEAEQLFLERLSSLNGSSRAEDVAGYRVYVDVTPLDEMRPRT